jgi:hypothetical protein
MEKIIAIGGKSVKFKATAGFLYRYRTYFGIEYSADLAKIANVSKKIKEDGADVLACSEEADTRVFQRILWTYAKTADPTIPDIDLWLDEFEEFDTQAIMAQLKDLIELTNKSIIKN